MWGARGLLPLVLVSAAVLAWLLIGNEHATEWLTARLAPKPRPGLVIGQLMRIDGQLKRIHGGEVQELQGPLSMPVELHDGDRLETNRDAHGLIQLNSKDELELLSLSAVSLQLWNPQDADAPVYLTLLTGDLEAKAAGVRGRAFVVREGRLYLPGQKALHQPVALTVSKSAPQDIQIAEGHLADVGPEDNALPGESTTGAVEPDTLSNEYIDEVIHSRQQALQKCWLTRLKDRPDLKGQMLVQFEITRRGKVRALKLVDSNLNDEPLQNCALSVIERIGFQSFKGQEITLSYPIRFE